DMDFMNLNQSAHGDREFGFITSRMRRGRKVVVGHWGEPEVQGRIAAWTRAAAGWHQAQHLRVVRFGDNMRQVAVTEGDKVEAQMQFGFAVNGHGVTDLVNVVRAIPESTVDEVVAAYDREYTLAASLREGGANRAALRDAARIEAGLRSFLQQGGFGAFTDTFEDLDGLPQLPGIAVQRLMAEGYGFGGEGDWKTAALVRLLKVMGAGLEGGTSFMEDYTYHLAPDGAEVLGAHMLEVCPTISRERPSAQIHPLSIGGKQPPVRLVFTAEPGPAVVVSLLDLGERFRLVANQVQVVPPQQALPNLPVARAMWKPEPNLAVAAEAWILAGGPHHTVFSQALGIEPLLDLAEIAGVEILVIDDQTRIRDFKNELRWNQVYYYLARGL
ncbi:MAG: L-arabinose isomerase, partial [Chloroflexi bacterium]|nr:L-arabinose isomerase [Chloroflexota bacterium]